MARVGPVGQFKFGDEAFQAALAEAYADAASGASAVAMLLTLASLGWAMQFYREVLGILLQNEQFLAAMLGLSLALVGLYGLMAYSVSRRTREIGIRMAIGADPRSVVRMVLRQGLQLTALGLAVGLVASLGVSRVLMAAFHGLAPVDPVALILLPLALLAVSAFAILAPAYRAARIEPTTALRQD